MNIKLDINAQVKQILKTVQELAPGRSVELRNPPYSAIHSVKCGNHRRGTPPNEVEMSGHTLIKLVENPTYWKEFCFKGLISASGTNANLEDLFTQVSKLGISSK